MLKFTQRHRLAKQFDYLFRFMATQGEYKKVYFPDFLLKKFNIVYNENSKMKFYGIDVEVTDKNLIKFE